MTQLERSKLDTLLSFVLVNQRAFEARRHLSDRLSDSSPLEVERQCIDGLNEWLGVSCGMFFQIAPSTKETVEAMGERDFLAFAVFHLDYFATAFPPEPANEHSDFLRTLIDLLLVLDVKRDLEWRFVQGELVAASLLCSALRNSRLGRPLLENVQGEVFVTNELYGRIVVMDRFVSVLDEVGRWFDVTKDPNRESS